MMFAKVDKPVKTKSHEAVFVSDIDSASLAVFNQHLNVFHLLSRIPLNTMQFQSNIFKF